MIINVNDNTNYILGFYLDGDCLEPANPYHSNFFSLNTNSSVYIKVGFIHLERFDVLRKVELHLNVLGVSNYKKISIHYGSKIVDAINQQSSSAVFNITKAIVPSIGITVLKLTNYSDNTIIIHTTSSNAYITYEYAPAFYYHQNQEYLEENIGDDIHFKMNLASSLFFLSFDIVKGVLCYPISLVYDSYDTSSTFLFFFPGFKLNIFSSLEIDLDEHEIVLIDSQYVRHLFVNPLNSTDENLYYDTLGTVTSLRITNIDTYFNTGSLPMNIFLHRTSYSYDNKNNISSMTILNDINNPNSPINYSYDELDRLIETEDGDNLITYTYDLYGNLVEISSVNQTSNNGTYITYTYSSSNPYLMTSRINGNITNGVKQSPNPILGTVNLTYDSNLNLISIAGSNPTFTGTKTMSYQRGRLLSQYCSQTGNILHPTTHTTTYKYNYKGLRTRKVVDDVVHNYLYDSNDNLIGDDCSEYKIIFLYDKVGMTGFVINDNGTYTSFFYVKNLFGDVIELRDIDGSLVAKYRYTPYGETTVLNPDDSINTSSSFIGNINPIRYRGYYFDIESSFYYVKSRYYVPYLSRWLTMDSLDRLNPKDPTGLNLFTYAKNNPIKYTDVDGHETSLAVVAFLIGFLFGFIFSLVEYRRRNYDIGKALCLSLLHGLISGLFAVVNAWFGFFCMDFLVFELPAPLFLAIGFVGNFKFSFLESSVHLSIYNERVDIDDCFTAHALNALYNVSFVNGIQGATASAFCSSFGGNIISMAFSEAGDYGVLNDANKILPLNVEGKKESNIIFFKVKDYLL